MELKEEFGPWTVFFNIVDGARISRLVYNDTDILTKEVPGFRPPEMDYGKYETRPVYGYDDCFPSVDSCRFPGLDWEIPDHGELCWLSWQVNKESDRLIFSVDSNNMPVQFIREMRFGEDELVWNFKVINRGEETVPFQHVMHPLLPLERIKMVHLPGFKNVFDDINQIVLDIKTAESMSEFLLSRPVGSFSMLYLQQIEKGWMSWDYDTGVSIEADFPDNMFPSIGIWWNNQAYPDENSLRRTECAFEPVPGLNSVLSDAFKEKQCLYVRPKEIINWQIKWRVKLNND